MTSSEPFGGTIWGHHSVFSGHHFGHRFVAPQKAPHETAVPGTASGTTSFFGHHTRYNIAEHYSSNKLARSASLQIGEHTRSLSAVRLILRAARPVPSASRLIQP